LQDARAKMPDYSEIVGAASGVDRRVRFWENERPPMEQCGMKTYSLFSAWLRVAATYAGVALSLLVLAPLALPESPPPLLGRFIFPGYWNSDLRRQLASGPHQSHRNTPRRRQGPGRRRNERLFRWAGLNRNLRPGNGNLERNGKSQ